MGERTIDIRTVAVLALVGALVFAVPLLTADRYLLKVLTFVGINVIIITGMALLFGYAGQVSLGHAAFYGIGAYTSAYVVTSLGWPWLGGVALAVAVTSVGGLLLALPSLRLKGHYLAMATLGFGEIMRVVFVEARGITGGPDGFSGIPFASVGGLAIDSAGANYWLIWGVAAAMLALAANLVRSRAGRAMRALHGSELGALACGIDLTGLKVRVFVISAALAGLAGALYAHVVGFISPSTFSLHASVVLVAMAVLGGTRSLAGPVLAAALLTLIPFADAVIPGLSRSALETIQEWQEDIYGLTIIAVLLFVPGGVAGALRRLSRVGRRWG
ncbi:MAG: branched-chain amino acid ABC transporter permease [Anaerosomatales bacterium]|nr:branched-chain amino acid ABC transporter permease [Anaerosomatales bacterium]MDT8433331.1 branched-chain amino acid ABC transporter permease [Anaerosomatales bacterium]